MVGTINGSTRAILLDENKNIVGTCAFTPNAIAYCMARHGAVVAQCALMGTKTSTDGDMPDRVKNAGWLSSDKEAMFVGY